MSSPFISDNNPIPEWHMPIVRERVKSYIANPEQAIDFNDAMDEIEADFESLSGNEDIGSSH